MSKTREGMRDIVSICGSWWALMSGGVSIPLAFFALILGGSTQIWFAILAYVSLWCLVCLKHREVSLLKKTTPVNRACVIQTIGAYRMALTAKIQQIKGIPAKYYNDARPITVLESLKDNYQKSLLKNKKSELSIQIENTDTSLYEVKDTYANIHDSTADLLKSISAFCLKYPEELGYNALADISTVFKCNTPPSDPSEENWQAMQDTLAKIEEKLGQIARDLK